MTDEDLWQIVHNHAPLLPESQKQALVQEMRRRVLAPVEAREQRLLNALPLNYQSSDHAGYVLVREEDMRQLFNLVREYDGSTALRAVEQEALEHGREQAARIADRRYEEHQRLVEHYALQRSGQLTAAKHFSQAATARPASDPRT